MTGLRALAVALLLSCGGSQKAPPPEDDAVDGELTDPASEPICCCERIAAHDLLPESDCEANDGTCVATEACR